MFCGYATGLAGSALDTHADPVLVKTLPEVPDEVKPVPPLPTGSVPEAVDTLTGGRMLERVAMLSSG
jgi:hypothetical protein